VADFDQVTAALEKVCPDAGLRSSHPTVSKVLDDLVRQSGCARASIHPRERSATSGGGGQSMAGFVAPSVAAELDADRLVLLNAMTSRPRWKNSESGSTTPINPRPHANSRSGATPRDGVDPDLGQ